MPTGIMLSALWKCLHLNWEWNILVWGALGQGPDVISAAILERGKRLLKGFDLRDEGGYADPVQSDLGGIHADWYDG